MTVGTASLAGSGAAGEIDTRNVGGSACGYLKRLIVGVFRGAQFRRRAVWQTAAHRERRNRVDGEKHAAGSRSGVGKA